jgi:hypothetical protein
VVKIKPASQKQKVSKTKASKVKMISKSKDLSSPLKRPPSKVVKAKVGIHKKAAATRELKLTISPTVPSLTAAAFANLPMALPKISPKPT